MTPSPNVSLHGAAPVFVVQDVLRSVEHYRDGVDAASGDRVTEASVAKVRDCCA